MLRIRGKLDEAEAAYRQAAELGHEPQPGLLLAWLGARSDRSGDSGGTPIAGRGARPGARSWLLPAAVQVMVVAQLSEEARQYADELSGIAAAFGNSALQAAAAYAAATVELASGEMGEALRQARDSLSTLERHRIAVRDREDSGFGRACPTRAR